MAVTSPASESMDVLVLTPYLYGTAPGPRSSVELWERVLAPAGISFHYEPFEDEALHNIIHDQGRLGEKTRRMTYAYARRFATVRTARDYDAVLVYREAALIGPELFERWVRRLRVPIVYQLDDPIYLRYRSPSNGYLAYLKFSDKVGRIARMASMTIVNSRHHFDYVSRYTSRIRLIPILVDGEKFVPTVHRREGKIRVGWSGSPTTSGNLGLIGPSLRSLSDRSDVELRFIGGKDYPLPGVKFTPVPWRAETEVVELSQLDVGLLPVPNTEWNKRKFFMKLIQYMSLGIPPVCTPLGANTEVITHGVDGLFATTRSDWDNQLTRLITDPDLRVEIGAQAAETAHARYTVQARAEDILEAFRAVIADGARSPSLSP